jgi:putative redox protein
LEFEASFPGGVRVDVTVGGYTVSTDQPEKSGGGGSAPSPFDLFLASFAACAGYYALRFCQSRDIPTEGLGVSMEADWDAAEKRVSTVRITVRPPKALPPHYREALMRSIDGCTVKRNILNPPAFELAYSDRI